MIGNTVGLLHQHHHKHMTSPLHYGVGIAMTSLVNKNVLTPL